MDDAKFERGVVSNKKKIEDDLEEPELLEGAERQIQNGAPTKKLKVKKEKFEEIIDDNGLDNSSEEE